MFDSEELSYIKQLVEESKRSLDDITDENRLPLVSWVKDYDVKYEYEIIDSILEKIGEDNG